MGIKRYTIQFGLVLLQAIYGPRVTKGLIWAERRHGPYMGRKLQRDGIILDNPYEATEPNLDRL